MYNIYWQIWQREKILLAGSKIFIYTRILSNIRVLFRFINWVLRVSRRFVWNTPLSRIWFLTHDKLSATIITSDNRANSIRKGETDERRAGTLFLPPPWFLRISFAVDGADKNICAWSNAQHLEPKRCNCSASYADFYCISSFLFTSISEPLTSERPRNELTLESSSIACQPRKKKYRSRLSLCVVGCW